MSNNYHTQLDPNAGKQQNILRDVAMNHQLIPGNNYVQHGTPIAHQNIELVGKDMKNYPGTPVNHQEETVELSDVEQDPPKQSEPQVSQQQTVVPSPPQQQLVPPHQTSTQVVKRLPSQKKAPTKQPVINYTTIALIFLLFIVVVYPKTGGVFNKYIPPISGDFGLKAVIMRGLLFVVLFVVFKYILSFVGK